MTSNRIMKIVEHEKSIMYRAACDCTDQNCDITLDMEIDESTKMIILALYKKLHWSSYWKDDDNWFKNKWLRIKGATKLLFTGYIEVEEYFYMYENQIDDFIKAIQEGKKKLEEFRNENVN